MLEFVDKVQGKKSKECGKASWDRSCGGTSEQRLLDVLYSPCLDFSEGQKGVTKDTKRIRLTHEALLGGGTSTTYGCFENLINFL